MPVDKFGRRETAVQEIRRRPCSDFMDMLRRLISCRIIIIIIQPPKELKRYWRSRYFIIQSRYNLNKKCSADICACMF